MVRNNITYCSVFKQGQTYESVNVLCMNWLQVCLLIVSTTFWSAESRASRTNPRVYSILAMPSWMDCLLIESVSYRVVTFYFRHCLISNYFVMSRKRMFQDVLLHTRSLLGRSLHSSTLRPPSLMASPLTGSSNKFRFLELNCNASHK